MNFKLRLTKNMYPAFSFFINFQDDATSPQIIETYMLKKEVLYTLFQFLIHTDFKNNIFEIVEVAP